MRIALIQIIDFSEAQVQREWPFLAIAVMDIPCYRTKISMFDRLFPVKPKNPI
jgi:hypothetical protein